MFIREMCAVTTKVNLAVAVGEGYESSAYVGSSPHQHRLGREGADCARMPTPTGQDKVKPTEVLDCC